MERILENFPYIKNRIINLSEEELFAINMTYGDDVIALDIDVPEDSDFIPFKDGVLFKLFGLSVATISADGKHIQTFVLATGVKLTEYQRLLSARYCVIMSDVKGDGSFQQSVSNFWFMNQYDNVDDFNKFWRLNPGDECYAVAGQ